MMKELCDRDRNLKKHANARSLPRLGVWEPIGHADYYPNGGRAQSGCQNLLIGGLYDFIYCELLF